MVVAQLVEQLLPTPEISSSNLVGVNFQLLSTVLKIQKEKKKEAGHCTIFKQIVNDYDVLKSSLLLQKILRKQNQQR